MSPDAPLHRAPLAFGWGRCASCSGAWPLADMTQDLDVTWRRIPGRWVCRDGRACADVRISAAMAVARWRVNLTTPVV